MKKFLPLMLFCIVAQISFAQLPPLNITLQDQWDADTLPTAGSNEYNDIWGFVDCSGNEYAIMGSAGMIHFFNISDPQNIEELAHFSGGDVTSWRDIKTYRDRAYAVSDNTTEGLMVFDMSNIQDTIIKTYHSNEFFNKCHNIYIDEENGRLYAAGTNTQNSGLIVFDIATDPDVPQVLASVSLPQGGYVHDVYVKDNIAYCSHGNNGFYVWDFGDPENPVHRADVETGNYNHSSWVTPDGAYAIYAEEVPIGMPLGVIDLSEMAFGNIEVVHTFKFPLLAPEHENNRPHNPFIRGNYLIVSYYHDGVQIFDISDPLNPIQVAHYDTHDNAAYSGYKGCWGVYPYFPSGVIIASDINEGLLVLTADSLDFAPVDPNLTPDATLITEIPSPFCEGEQGLITVESGADNYQWYKDNQPISVNQNFLFIDTSGTYRVEITEGQCSAVSDEMSVTLSEGPDLSFFPTDDYDLCENETLLMTAPDTLDEYIWLKDGNIYQNGGNSLEISEAGDYNLLAYLDGCSSTSDILTIAILTAPEAMILNEELSFCEGDELTLEANNGGEEYAWFLNNSQIGQTLDNNFSATQGGNYQVSVSAEGCSAISEIAVVVENELPEMELSFLGLSGSVDTNHVYLCYDESFTLAVPANATSQFQWYKNNEPTGTNTNTLEITEEGIYHLEATTENDCSDTSEVVQVSISQPVAHIDLNAGVLSNQDDWASYQWFMDGNIIEGETSATYEPTASGEYYCVITNDVGCESVSNYVQVIVNSIGDVSDKISFSAYPNPVDDILHIQLNAAARQTFEIELFHANGQMIRNENIEILGFQTINLDLSKFASGVYFIRLVSDEKQAIQRLVKR